MLQSISDKLKSQRWLMTALLGLLALIFAAWGAYGIVNVSFSPQDYGLKVNGERVSTETLNRAWQERQAQYAQALNGATLPPAQTRMLQQQLLNEYVRETLLRQRAQASGYRASDAQVLAAYQSEPGFQVDGKFSALAAKTMLAQIGLTPETYEAERRQALQISQLTEGIQLSDFLTAAQLNRIYALENEQREVRYALLPAERYAAAAKIDDAQIKAWYDAHPGDYMSPESVRLQYAQLSLDAIAGQITVKDEDLQAYYDKNKSRYSENEKRHAHHILISIGDGGYVQQSWMPWAGRLHFTMGARWDHHSIDDVAVVSPQASASLVLAQGTRLQLGFGQYVQYPEIALLMSPLGSRGLLPTRSNHLLAAVEQRLGPRTRIRAEYYNRVDRDLPF